MTIQSKRSKMGKKGVGKSAQSRQDAHKISQKQVTKSNVSQVSLRPVQRLLKRLVQNVATKKITSDYQVVADQLSSIAGLQNGHSWGWHYIASVISGSVKPSKKFTDVVILASENINPKKEQWFYFSRRKSIVAYKEKSCLREIVKAHMKERGYKLVTFKRYMQVKKMMRKGR